MEADEKKKKPEWPELSPEARRAMKNRWKDNRRKREEIIGGTPPTPMSKEQCQDRYLELQTQSGEGGVQSMKERLFELISLREEAADRGLYEELPELDRQIADQKKAIERLQPVLSTSRKRGHQK